MMGESFMSRTTAFSCYQSKFLGQSSQRKGIKKLIFCVFAYMIFGIWNFNPTLKVPFKILFKDIKIYFEALRTFFFFYKKNNILCSEKNPRSTNFASCVILAWVKKKLVFKYFLKHCVVSLTPLQTSFTFIPQPLLETCLCTL